MSVAATVIGFLLCLLAAFVAGFFAGDSVGTKDTERRWSEAVGRATHARSQSDDISFLTTSNALDEIRRLTIAHADCQRGRIGDAENAGRLLGIISSLKSGSCWCGIGIGNPMVTGSHSEACKAAAEAVGAQL